MAFTEFYCQTTGSNLNAGSTTADTAAYTATNGNWSSTTGVFTPTSGNPSLSVAVGDFCSVYPDAATVGVFVARVTAVSATTITLSTTAKAGTAPTTAATGLSLKAGGAWKGPNGASGFPFGFVAATLTNAAGDFPRVNWKGGTNYAITAAMTHAVGGPAVFQGYTFSPGDGGKATVDGGTAGASYILLTVSSNQIILADFIFQNNGASGSATGVNVTGNSGVYRLAVNSVRGAGLSLGNASTHAVECEAYGCNQSNTANLGGLLAPSQGAHFLRCVSHDNAGSNNCGLVVTGAGARVEHSVMDTNGLHGVRVNNSAINLLLGVDCYNNGGDGVTTAGFGCTNLVENCNLVKNGGYGLNFGNSNVGRVVNCAFGSGTQANTSGQVNNPNGMSVSGSVTYAADVTPWVDPANGDFRINLTEAKGAGRGAFTQTQAGYAGTVAYPDIGAAQHQEVASGGGGVLISSVGSQLIKAGW